MGHSASLRFKKMRDVSGAAATARSILHKKVRELVASAKQTSQHNKAIKSSHSSSTGNLHTTADKKEPTITDTSPSAVKKFNQSSTGICKIMKHEGNNKKLRVRLL